MSVVAVQPLHHRTGDGSSWAYQIGGVLYERNMDGSPITFVQALNAVEGQRFCTVYRPDGTEALVNAGSFVARHITWARARAARERNVRHTSYVSHLSDVY